MNNYYTNDANAVVEVLLNEMKELQKSNAILQVNVVEKDSKIKKLNEQLTQSKQTKKDSHK